mmetsp:Transcript_2578/g.3997  ORF Transcript_2578/g.3997 Transcript_2578/m.3997 type:complete len:94 (+) Transcript_2578:710-991(+)
MITREGLFPEKQRRFSPFMQKAQLFPPKITSPRILIVLFLPWIFFNISLSSFEIEFINSKLVRFYSRFVVIFRRRRGWNGLGVLFTKGSGTCS